MSGIIKHKNSMLAGLDFYKAAINYMRDRLYEAAGRDEDLFNSHDLQYFQNRFIGHRKEIENLSSEFKEQLMKMSILTVENGKLDDAELDHYLLLTEKFFAMKMMIDYLRDNLKLFIATDNLEREVA